MLLDGYCGNTVAWMGNVRAAVFLLFYQKLAVWDDAV